MVAETAGIASRMSGKAGHAILVPVDGSKGSQKCFDMALRFAKRGDVVKVPTWLSPH